jgi:hypothetical protein
MAIVDISGVSAGALNLKNLMDGVLEKTVEVFGGVQRSASFKAVLDRR